jgi:hypothetical protein
MVDYRQHGNNQLGANVRSCASTRGQ